MTHADFVAWHQAMGIPVINLVHYRTGTRAEYARDLASRNPALRPRRHRLGAPWI